MTAELGLVLALVWSAQVPPPNAAAVVSRNLRAEFEAIRAKEAKAGDELAARLEKQGDSTLAKRIRAEAALDRTGTAGASVFRPLPDIIPPPEKGGKESAGGAEWTRIREGSVAAFDALAKKALKTEATNLALAEACLREIVARKNDPWAYRLLGYVPHEGGWATPFAVQQLKDGMVSHPVFGWVEKEWVPHLDRGELPAPAVPGRPTRWLPAAEADAMRREWGKGWRINTEHFAIQANVPLAEVISFGNKLERFHDLFNAMMADVVGTESQLAQLAKNPKLAPSIAKKRHKVFYFAEKSEYVQYLQPFQGAAASVSLGTYIPPRLSRPKGNSASYFFRDIGGQLDVVSTLYHEVSHQLLFESSGKDGYEDSRPGYWVFEGLGTYFETVTPRDDGAIEVGGLVGPRIEAARDRLIKNREFIPVGRFVTYSKPVFNSEIGDGDVYLHYAQAMALTVFLMQAKGEAYREGFLDHVRDVYKGRTGKTLEDRLGIGYGTINRELLDYLREPAEK